MEKKILNSLNKVAMNKTSFMLLFLSDGFTDEKEFNSHCKKLADEFLKIEPYYSQKKYIGIWSLFVRSNQNSINNTSGDTAFKFFRNPEGFLETKEPGRIIDALITCEIKFGSGGGSGEKSVSADDIWVNPTTKGQRVACVIANDYIKAPILHSHFGKLEYPTTLTPELENFLPFITISRWPALSEYQNNFEAAAYLLAHQMGLFFGLGAEYELGGDEYKYYNANKQLLNDQSVLESKYPNLTTAYDLCPSLKPDVEQLNDSDWLEKVDANSIPWINFNRFGDRKNEIMLKSHPTADDDESINNFVREMSKFILLEHINPEMENLVEYVREDDPFYSFSLLTVPNLIEGGGYFRKNVFRPYVSCLMRHEGFKVKDKPVFTGIPYCNVCRAHIKTKLGGTRNFYLGGVYFIPTAIPKNDLPLNSRIAERFVNHVNDTKNVFIQSPKLNCVAALLRRIESFFVDVEKLGKGKSNVLKWQHGNCPMTILQERWGGTTLKYPNSYNFKIKKEEWDYIHGVAMSSVEKFKENRDVFIGGKSILDFISTGIPGVMELLGFCRIANPEYKNRAELPETLRRIRVLAREPIDFSSIQPGSILQGWPSWQTYYYMLLYINGLKPDREELVKEINDHDKLIQIQEQLQEGVPEQKIKIYPCAWIEKNPNTGKDDLSIWGHSGIYMGEINGFFCLADQDKIDKSFYNIGQKKMENLFDGPRFRFWIVAEWFSGENIPK
jgi:hypothetical protein